MHNAFFRTAAELAGAIKLLTLCAVLEGPGLEMPETPQETRSDRLVDVPSPNLARGHEARPVVIVYTSPACSACRKFERWLADNDDTCKLRFTHREAPDWVERVPAFHYRTEKGWRVRYGFSKETVELISKEIQ